MSTNAEVLLRPCRSAPSLGALPHARSEVALTRKRGEAAAFVMLVGA